MLDEKRYGFLLLKTDGFIGVSKITPISKAQTFFKGFINVNKLVTA